MPSAKWMKKKLRESFPINQTPTMKCFELWRSYFLQGTDRDRWGQPEPAIKFYEMLLNDFHQVLRNGESVTNEQIYLQNEQRETISKMIHCFNCRINSLKDPSKDSWMTLDRIMKLKPVLKNFEHWQGLFPVLLIEEPCSSKVSLLSQDSGLSELYTSNENLEKADINEFLPRLPWKEGLTRLYIHIIKFGMRDIKKVIQPYLVISLRDRDSVNLCDIQPSNCAQSIQDFHAVFDNCFYDVQRYIEKIPKGSALFFELRSSADRLTKYYSVLTKEKFTTGKGFLELYKGKPDYHRKNMKKATHQKPLYFHIEMKILESN